MMLRISLLGLWVCGSLWASSTKEILLVAGQPSHGPGEHKYFSDCELLAKCMNASGLPLRASVVNGWPSHEQLDNADSLFILSDGLEQHVASGKTEELRRHVNSGKGLGVIHFALEPSDSEMAAFFDETLGGHFVIRYSVNPMWTLQESILGEHPINRGVKLTPITDEWYFHIRFVQPIEPLLQAHPPLSVLGEDGPRSGNASVREDLSRNAPQTLAWARMTPSGARGFGFTGGHYHRNWSEPGYRTLVLNAMVWTAGLKVPDEGVSSNVTPIPKYPTIAKAISAGDLQDVQKHLEIDPASLERGTDLPPLAQAILRRKVEIARLLISRGADVNKADSSQRTPLHLAVERALPELVSALLSAKADPEKLDAIGWTPLHHAAANNQLDVARALLKGGAKAGSLSQRGGTPLHEAAASAGADLVRLLLEAGVDPKIVSKEGVTALDIARKFNNTAALEVLAGVGAGAL